MRKTAFWVITGALLTSLLIGAAIGRMAGGGSPGAVSTWSPPPVTTTTPPAGMTPVNSSAPLATPTLTGS